MMALVFLPTNRRKSSRNSIAPSIYRISKFLDLGLGLSYVRQIAEAHHGQVSLRSEVGKGTEVTVGLPI